MIERHNDSILDKMEAVMAACFPKADIRHFHFFAPGVYARVMVAPAGTWLTSRIHKTTHIFIVSAGSIKVTMEGRKKEIIRAPFHGVTIPGTRRAAVTLETTVWTTVHALPYIHGTEGEWEEEDLQELLARIEEEILEPQANPYLTESEKPKEVV